MEQSKPMSLPEAWKEKIERDAESAARLQFHPVYSADQNTACRITYRNGAMAYAPWLYTCQMNYTALRARCERMEQALKEAQVALETCYDVTEYPANGETRQDEAIRIICESRAALEPEPGEMKEENKEVVTKEEYEQLHREHEILKGVVKELLKDKKP